MEDYNDFTYEPEAIETELKSEDIRKFNQDSNTTKRNKRSHKRISGVNSNSNNRNFSDSNPNMTNTIINSNINITPNTNIINNSISNGNNNLIANKTKSNNMTTEIYMKEFDINYSKEMKEIERELNKHEYNKKEYLFEKLSNKNRSKEDFYIKINNDDDENSQELDTARVECLIEKVLNNNENTNTNINDNDNEISNKLNQSKTPKTNCTKAIEVNREDQKDTRENNVKDKLILNDNSNDSHLHFQTVPNEKLLNLKEKRMKSASSIFRNSNTNSESLKRLSNPQKDDSYQLLSNELEILINTPAKTPTELSLQNKAMIHYLTKLNTILSKQINTKTHQVTLPNNTLLQKSAKVISIYQKEYFKLEARLKQLSDANYESNLFERLSQLKKDIAYYEEENHRLKQIQKSSEVMLSTQTKHISNSTIELRRLEMDYEQIQKQHSIIMNKVTRNKEIIKDNDNKINQLKEFSKNMETSAQETYGIVAFDNVNEIQMKNEANKEKKRQLEKNYEILEKASKSNKNKYESEIRKNEKLIYMLKKNKMELQIEINKGEDEQKKQGKINIPFTSSLSIKREKGDKCEIYSPQKNNSNDDGILPEISRNIGNSKDKEIIEILENNKEKEINQMRISKEKVIQQLEMKANLKKKEKLIEHNNSYMNAKNNSSNNIIEKNIMNKPNIAFTQIKKKDIRHTNTNAIANANNHKKDILISDLSEIRNNTSNNNQSYSNKEIIEEIKIDSLSRDKYGQSQQKIELLNDTVPEFLKDLKDTKSDNNNNNTKDNQRNDNSNDPYWLNENGNSNNKEKQIDEVQQNKEEEKIEEGNEEEKQEKDKKEEEEHYTDKFGVNIDITEKTNTNILMDLISGEDKKFELKDQAKEKEEKEIIDLTDIVNNSNSKQETEKEKEKEKKPEDKITIIEMDSDNKKEESKINNSNNNNNKNIDNQKNNMNNNGNNLNSEIEVTSLKSSTYNENKIIRSNKQNNDNSNEFEDLEELQI